MNLLKEKEKKSLEIERRLLNDDGTHSRDRLLRYERVHDAHMQAFGSLLAGSCALAFPALMPAGVADRFFETALHFLRLCSDRRNRFSQHELFYKLCTLIQVRGKDLSEAEEELDHVFGLLLL